MKLKTAFLLPFLDQRAAGLATVVTSLQGELARGTLVESEMFAVDRSSKWRDLLGKDRARIVREVLAYGPDIIHTHGLWVAHSRAGARLAARHGLPEIISPHGMLDQWAMRHRAWKKRIAWEWFERRHVANSRIVHACSESERLMVRELGVRTPIVVIPNGVRIPTQVPSVVPPWAESFEPGTKVLLFLGRMHPKKGLEPLIRAWARQPDAIRQDGWRLALVGWDDGGHAAGYQRLIDELALNNSCKMFGPVFGDKFSATLTAASAFILPSYSEGMPMTVLDAWAHGLPVLMTAACNIPIGFTAGAAMQISTEPDVLAEQLTQILSLKTESWAGMSAAGRALVENQFTWANVAGRFVRLYQWMANGGPPPDFVSFD